MPYKTILVHVEPGAAAAQRMHFAARLARTFDAHLTGCALTGVSRFILPDISGMRETAITAFCAAARARAARALQQFAQIALEHDVTLAEQRLIDDDACGMALHARYADLVVVSQPDDAMPTRGSSSDLPGYLLRESGRPILVVPRTIDRLAPFDKVLLAWDGSAEATRAAIGALPVMRLAHSVSVMHVYHGRSVLFEETSSCSKMAQYLRRQGITVAIRHGSGVPDSAHALLSAAADADAGLLVMGGFGRSPLHESLLGGVTASILASMTLPVLLAG